jgi:Co/Zn/Cd efflux system component
MLRLMVVTIVLILTLIGVGLASKATNEGSYTYGYWRGSLTCP